MTLLRVEFTNQFEDYREAQFAHAGGQQSISRKKVGVGLIGWSIFVLVALIFFLLLQSRSTRAMTPPSISPPQQTVSVWSILLPLLPWLFISVFFWFTISQAIRGTGKGLRGNLGFRNIQRQRLAALLTWPVIFVGIGYFWTLLNNIGEPATVVTYIPILGWLVMGITLAGFVRRSGEWTARRGWEGQPHLSRPNVVEFTEEKLIVQDRMTRHEFSWQGLPAFCETPNMVLVYVSDLGFILIPKRAFTDDTQLETCRQILQSKIADPTQAFPVLPVAPLPLPLPGRDALDRE